MKTGVASGSPMPTALSGCQGKNIITQRLTCAPRKLLWSRLRWSALGPEADLEGAGGLTEPHEEHLGRKVSAHSRIATRDIPEHCDDPFRIGVARDADVEVDRRRRSHSVQLVTFFSMIFELGTITSAPSGVRRAPRAHADAEHIGAEIAQLDGIPDLDRAFEEQNQSRDEVVHDLLETEADLEAEALRRTVIRVRSKPRVPSARRQIGR
jgi:hypothetical protein